MSLSFYLFLSFVWLANLVESQVPTETKTCFDRHCTFECTDRGECSNKLLLCDKTVQSCTLNCLSSGCKDGTHFVSHAIRTKINCDSKDSCVGANLHCGDTKDVQTAYGSCDLSCGVVGCKEAQFKCQGSFSHGCSARATKAEDGFTSGMFACNLKRHQKCTLQCEGNDCAGLNYHCNGSPLGKDCVCEGTGCSEMNVVTTTTTTADPNAKQNTKPNVVMPLPVKPLPKGIGGVQKKAVWYNTKYVKIDCRDGKCLTGAPIYCGASVKTCIINCFPGQCKAGMKLHSFAQMTIIHCLGIESCTESTFECGDSHKRPGVIGKYIGCYANCGKEACKKTRIQCTGDFSQGCAVAAGFHGMSSFENGFFECNIRNYGLVYPKSPPPFIGKCTLDCGKNHLAACSSANYTCSSKICLCEGHNCPAIQELPSVTAPIFTYNPTPSPTTSPSNFPSRSPSIPPTRFPTLFPTLRTLSPTTVTRNPSKSPTASPSKAPSKSPSVSPSLRTINPTSFPTRSPSNAPTRRSAAPSTSPSAKPSVRPTRSTNSPSKSPTMEPSNTPSKITPKPSISPTLKPSNVPTMLTTIPTSNTMTPTEPPTRTTPKPTFSPTKQPTPYRGQPIGLFCEKDSECLSKNCAIQLDLGTRKLGVCVFPKRICFPLQNWCQPFRYQCCSGKCQRHKCMPNY